MSEYLLNSKVIGDKNSPTIVFLPGFAGSTDMWDTNFQALQSEQYRLIFLDTLGFGNSPKPDIAYSLDDHLEAIRFTLEKLGVTRFHLVGYSMGTLLALAYAYQFSSSVEKLVLLAWPCYQNEQQARTILKQTSLFTRLMALDNPLAHIICDLMCLIRPLVKPVLPLVVSQVPAVVAKGALDHTWTSYSRTLQHIIFQSHSQEWLHQLSQPVLLIHGRKDKTAPLANVQEVVKLDAQYMLVVLDEADHNLIFTHSQYIVREMNAFFRGEISSNQRI